MDRSSLERVVYNSAGNEERECIFMGNRQSSPIKINLNEITVVRRPGEGSRPLFDRDEIINHRRMIEEERRRHRTNFTSSYSGPEVRRDDYDLPRGRYIYSDHERVCRERDEFCHSCGRRCPTCHRFSDDEEIYRNRIFRTRSDERIRREYPYQYCEQYPSETAYYYVEDAVHYEVLGNLFFLPSLNYSYLPSYEY